MKVVITGGSGFLAGHLIRELQETATDVVTEIHTLDRKSAPSNVFDLKNGRIPLKHHCCDLNEREKVEEVLRETQVVFHLARRQFQFINSNADNEGYTNDNLKAVESLIDSMLTSNVQNLVFVGDAYSNVPSHDNFGNSEDIHNDVPGSYMLGHYGETRTLGELFARQKVGQQLANGKPFQATFLRPTMIYGEGETKVPNVLKKVATANGGSLSYIQGLSNGLLQFMYAGSLAALMVENMRLLVKTPEKCSGEFLYCMDHTECTHFYEFARSILECFGMRLDKPTPLILSYGRTLWHEWFRNPNSPQFSLSAFRLLFVYAVGFSNRKQQLIFEFRPTVPAKELMERTLNWIAENLSDGRKSTRSSSVLRTG
ncbi:3-beta hydroxysteroid dehydrogenase/isomerase domain and NAD(P)-binding domain-containing protein [Aphelenchoides besseyi]|nr:3-beta hydroxysteroid dehydrogenase/isomerase domain and NAD(P)-binding domain-containing protein [Aphelenchoides besseyi]KAI6194422.1 3-beta hydroxysteroid dehydrogenase/isomerase domain and NAD(P)-binding domain-containing protein [Aphelenchoides besseyi]